MPARDGYKRALDLTILLTSHLFLLPVWAAFWVIIPLAIWISDRGPVFYRQTRLGKNGKLFKVIKFRTMIPDAEKYTGAVWSTENDPRITRVGRVLRKFRLDEMPQLINILKGEMSFVGSRPERPEMANEFCKTVPNFHARLRVRPGIAGLAQARGRYATRPKDKLRYDNLYILTLNPVMDVELLVVSVLVAFKETLTTRTRSRQGSSPRRSPYRQLSDRSHSRARVKSK